MVMIVQRSLHPFWRHARPIVRSFMTRGGGGGGDGCGEDEQKGGGYQSIGSFHSENLGDLMLQSDDAYSPPPLPFEDDYDVDSIICSRDADTITTNRRRKDFMIDFDNWTFLNHGAFGGALAIGFHRAAAWRRHLEEQPLRYHDRELLPHLAHTGRILADFISGGKRDGANDDDDDDATAASVRARTRTNIALLPNVTTGLNTVISNYARVYGEENAHVVLWDTSYGSVKKMAGYYCKNVTEIPFQEDYLHRLQHEEPLQVLQEALVDAAGPAKDTLVDATGPARDRGGMPSLSPLSSGGFRKGHPLLILDHTSSNTALTFPIQDLARFVKQEINPNTIVVVDGAHGLLAQDLSFLTSPSCMIDIYVTNCHKWLAAPRGIAFLWAQPQWHDSLLRYPAVLSHGMDEPDLFSRFVWDGTRDYAAALSIPSVLDYWKTTTTTRSSNKTVSASVLTSPSSSPCDGVRREMREELRRGIQILTESWHPTSSTSDSSYSDCDPSDSWHKNGVTLAPFDTMLSPMALVRLPSGVGRRKTGTSFSSTDAKRIQDFLYHNKVEVPIKCINEMLYVRVSCHVYNTPQDFEVLADVMRKVPPI